MKNKIYEKEKVIKFLDLLIDDIENVEYFNIKDFINKFRHIDEHEKGYLPHSIESLGKTYGLFENTLKSDEWFKLTPKGIDLKEYEKGLNKFERKLKSRPLDLYQKLYLSFFILFGFFGIYKVIQPTVSVSDFQKLKTNFDILNSKFNSIEKLTLKPTFEQLNDTSRTKKNEGLKKIKNKSKTVANN